MAGPFNFTFSEGIFLSLMVVVGFEGGGREGWSIASWKSCSDGPSDSMSLIYLPSAGYRTLCVVVW